MSAYYNENDPFAAAWLRELIKAGLIADGEVDERSIELVQPGDVRGFVQCHFFAGIGGWSYALRLAGWPDGRECWTGSCPCQPFSSAGAQAGGHDSRDLWPVWFQLVKECRPLIVFGEQVEAAIGHGWLDRLCDDLEAEDYAIGACGLPGPCIGAFDIRQRLWFVAHADGERRTRERILLWADEARRDASEVQQAAGSSAISPLDDTQRGGTRRSAGSQGRAERPPQGSGEVQGRGLLQTLHASANAGDMGDTDSVGLQGSTVKALQRARRQNEGPETRCPSVSFWSDAEWLPCADGKARPVEPGTFPLADGIPARVGRLRGYGNAIKPQLAAAFIEAYLDSVGDR